MKWGKRIFAGFLAVALTVALAACGTAEPSTSGQGSQTAQKDPIKIATKPMTEQYILGEMLALVIEDATGYPTEITKGIGGGTSNIHPAMEKGDFDLYPEYTSSGWAVVLKHELKSVSDEEMFQKLKEEYHNKYGMTWIGLYGANNTYAVVVRGDVAREHDLETVSDLAKVSSGLVFGGNPDYMEREDGFAVLRDTYGLNFKKVVDLDIGLKYTALVNGDIDVTNGYTTDAQLGHADVAVLADDKQLQANYFGSTVVREDTLEEYPGLQEALEKMDGILTDSEMAQLNYSVEVEKKDEKQVAHDYLVSKGVIKE